MARRRAPRGGVAATAAPSASKFAPLANAENAAAVVGVADPGDAPPGPPPPPSPPLMIIFRSTSIDATRGIPGVPSRLPGALPAPPAASRACAIDPSSAPYAPNPACAPCAALAIMAL